MTAGLQRPANRCHALHPGCIRELLHAAAASGESISVTYRGGSTPGTVREILPLRFSAGGRVLARDIASGGLKTFRLDKIALPATSEDSAAVACSPARCAR